MSQRSRVLPGFGLSLGFTLAYVSLIVLIPLSAVFIKSLGIGWDGLWEILTSERILKSLQLSFSRRVRRPFYNDLSPFATFSDSRNFFGGNPNLNPEFTNAFEIGHIKYFKFGIFILIRKCDLECFYFFKF